MSLWKKGSPKQMIELSTAQVKSVLLVRPFMSYGKDERHYHKHIWQLPALLFDPNNDPHSRLTARSSELELSISELDLNPQRHFAAVRRDVRHFILKAILANKSSNRRGTIELR